MGDRKPSEASGGTQNLVSTGADVSTLVEVSCTEASLAIAIAAISMAPQTDGRIGSCGCVPGTCSLVDNINPSTARCRKQMQFGDASQKLIVLEVGTFAASALLNAAR